MADAARPAPPALRIQVCGPLVIERDGRRVDARLPGRQGRLLCGYLVLNRHRPVQRTELITALWPGAPPGNADSGLSALLSKLRPVLGPDVLVGRGAVRFAPDEAWIDLDAGREAVHHAQSAIARGDWHRAWAPAQIALFAAERGLLVGEEGDEEHEWLDEGRRRLGELRLRALEAYGLACLGVAGAELAAAVRVGARIVEVAPFRESGYRLLMRGLAAQGNQAEALRIYDGLRMTLRDQLGVSPSPATQELFAQLNR